ncbi:hypothetical protein [Flagellimonas algicola]|uniref:hypothetical protein n=1 Tax=Flagellimonas algicola TaxID=2583815 RepID=UPI00192A57C8|nr:hypothetical protein [Allomuricauda algicola]
MRTLIPTLVVLLFASQMHAQLERDKVLHFVGGGLFGLAGAGIAKHASDGNRVWTFVGAVAGSALVGVAKEAIDSGQQDNGWDNEDLLATVLGGVTVGVSIELFSKKRNKRRPMGSLTTQNFNPEDFRVNTSIYLPVASDLQLPTINALGFNAPGEPYLE